MQMVPLEMRNPRSCTSRRAKIHEIHHWKCSKMFDWNWKGSNEAKAFSHAANVHWSLIRVASWTMSCHPSLHLLMGITMKLLNELQSIFPRITKLFVIDARTKEGIARRRLQRGRLQKNLEGRIIFFMKLCRRASTGGIYESVCYQVLWHLGSFSKCNRVIIPWFCCRWLVINEFDKTYGCLNISTINTQNSHSLNLLMLQKNLNKIHTVPICALSLCWFISKRV